jgi:hypothetical protein
VTREDVEALEHGFQQVMKVTSQILTRQPNKKRKVDTTPLLSQNPFKDLQERIDALNNQPVYTSENLNALKTLFEDNRERNQQKKITRQGYSLNPIVNLFPHLTPIVEIDPRKRRKKKR